MKVGERSGKLQLFTVVWKMVGRENDGRESCSQEKDVAPYSATKSSFKEIVTRAFPEQMKAL